MQRSTARCSLHAPILFAGVSAWAGLRETGAAKKKLRITRKKKRTTRSNETKKALGNYSSALAFNSTRNEPSFTDQKYWNLSMRAWWDLNPRPPQRRMWALTLFLYTACIHCTSCVYEG